MPAEDPKPDTKEKDKKKAKAKSVSLKIKVIIVIFIAATGIFSTLTYIYYQDTQLKAGIIKVQKEDIRNKESTIENQKTEIGSQKNEISSLEAVVSNQSQVIDVQVKNISQLNFTVFDQKGIISMQIVELRRRAESINSLEGNVSLLKGQVKQKEDEIVSLTPFTKSYFVAAVKSDGGGAIIPLEIKITAKGTGLLAVNIKNVELQSGAQDSVRLAASIASKISGVPINNKDIDVSFVNQFKDIVSVDGPSAGGAMTVAIYAALTQKNINTNILMTGTIEATGAIGQVGGVDKKAEAAKNQGASRFLVPKGQKVSVAGIEVTEVANIQDAVSFVVS